MQLYFSRKAFFTCWFAHFTQPEWLVQRGGRHSCREQLKECISMPFMHLLLLANSRASSIRNSSSSRSWQATNSPRGLQHCILSLPCNPIFQTAEPRLGKAHVKNTPYNQFIPSPPIQKKEKKNKAERNVGFAL